MVRPKKYLGQHFLTDKGIAERITQSLEGDNYNTLIEIGPGKGMLTQFLFNNKDKNLIAVDLDEESIDFLRQNFPDNVKSFILDDFLSMDLSMYPKFGVIGNFPYNITSQIFFKILEYKENCEEVVCMIQKEVAERIVSDPGSKKYGILSVLLQTWYDTKSLFSVKPGSFFPPPEVHSTVIRLSRNGRKKIPCDEKFYKTVIKTGFNQRRKVLSNSLKGILLNLHSEDPVFRKRPEQLTVDEFISLASLIEESRE